MICFRDGWTFPPRCRANASKPATSHCRARLCLLELFFCAELTCGSLGEIRVTAIVALFVSLFWVRRASFPRDPDWLLKVKAPPAASFLSIWPLCPPDAWHGDTAAGSLELQHFWQSLYSKLLCNSLISLHINTLSSCTLSLSCCYPSLSCDIQHMPEVFGVIRCVWFESFFWLWKGFIFLSSYLLGSFSVSLWKLCSVACQQTNIKKAHFISNGITGSSAVYSTSVFHCSPSSYVQSLGRQQSFQVLFGINSGFIQQCYERAVLKVVFPMVALACIFQPR